MKSEHHILIIRLSSIGDVLLATAFIRQARIRFPEGRIDFVIKTEYSELLADNPHLNHIYKIETGKGIFALWRLRKLLKKNDYTYIFDLHNNIRSRILTCCWRKPQLVHIRKELLKRFLLVKFKKNTYTKITPVPQRYLRTGAVAQIKDDHNGLEMFWKDTAEKEVSQKLRIWGIKEPYFVIAPGATYFSKRWLMEYYKELIKIILQNHREQIILLGSKKESDSFEELCISDRVVNVAGQLTLQQAGILLSRASATVSNDSGLMHMSVAVKTPVLAIFGSTVKELGFFPYRSKYFVLENKTLACRPCSHVGKNYCPKGHFKCMTDLKPQSAYRLFKRLAI